MNTELNLDDLRQISAGAIVFRDVLSGEVLELDSSTKSMFSKKYKKYLKKLKKQNKRKNKIKISTCNYWQIVCKIKISTLFWSE